MATFGTFTTGQVLTAAELNAAGAYTSYTPTYGNLTLGNGSVTAYYTKFNQIVEYAGYISFGSTTSITGTVSISLPVNTAYEAYKLYGRVLFLDASAGAFYVADMFWNTANSVIPAANNAAGTWAVPSGINATTPFTWGTSDVISWSMTYKAA